ncbi:MAG: GxxExxY protein [Anaerolineae bacterium]|nr:GxxExxY protein [Anaerolineae bacterium]
MSKIDPQEPINQLTEKVIGAAIEVHRHLGPGLLESAYETCLIYELEKLGLNVERQKPLPVVYKDIYLDQGYRIDLLVEGQVIVELKAVNELTDVHKAQALSYLKFSNSKIALLINFNVKKLVDGIRRFRK